MRTAVGREAGIGRAVASAGPSGAVGIVREDAEGRPSAGSGAPFGAAGPVSVTSAAAGGAGGGPTWWAAAQAAATPPMTTSAAHTATTARW
ncbi:hypothetical protein [Myceligenerans salitolerans]|uniref:hypothetical protein n=1 Tax=Myceligenerans salitolerans TaxID=1230528 RepID=UPI001F5F6B87|nr:hypothetical protein [Myceligenerans salitolerans]